LLSVERGLRREVHWIICWREVLNSIQFAIQFATGQVGTSFTTWLKSVLGRFMIAAPGSNSGQSSSRAGGLNVEKGGLRAPAFDSGITRRNFSPSSIVVIPWREAPF
jgi:hypothetical protein